MDKVIIEKKLDEEQKNSAYKDKEQRRKEVSTDMSKMEQMMEASRRDLHLKETAAINDFKYHVAEATPPATNENVKKVEEKLAKAKLELPAVEAKA